MYPCSSLISSSDSYSCCPTRPLPLLQTPSRLLAIRTTYDTIVQKAKEEAEEDDEPIDMHFATHTPLVSIVFVSART
jgi:hypothetical protein